MASKKYGWNPCKAEKMVASDSHFLPLPFHGSTQFVFVQSAPAGVESEARRRDMLLQAYQHIA